MRDAVGNELKVGDLVAIQIATPLVRGRIVEIRQGGIITGLKNGQQEIRPAVIAVSAIHTIQAHPQMAAVNEILCLREDNPPEMPKSEGEEAKLN